MDNSWVKLYRKLMTNEVMRDAIALQVFVWCLLQVDKKTGEFNTGRFIGAAMLALPPSTFRNALYRLCNKYRIISIKSTNKFSTISLLNWAKYQASQNEDNKRTQSEDTRKQPQNNNDEDNKKSLMRTTRGQQKDTKQEYKNREEQEYIYNNEKSDDFSDLKKKLDIPEKPPKGVYTEHQVEGIRIAKVLGVSQKRYSAYIKVVKESPRARILDAYGYAQDYLDPQARDKMFFWKLNHP